jgi:hypothetical protein
VAGEAVVREDRTHVPIFQPDGIRDGHVPMDALQDVVQSITADHRADGEYWVWIEDDGYTRSLLYRWSPGAE